MANITSIATPSLVEFTYTFLSGSIGENGEFQTNHRKPNFSNKCFTDGYYYPDKTEDILEEIFKTIFSNIIGKNSRYVHICYKFPGNEDAEVFVKLTSEGFVSFTNLYDWYKEGILELKDVCENLHKSCIQRYKNVDIRKGSYRASYGEKPYIEKSVYIYCSQNRFAVRDYIYQGRVTERFFESFVVDI